MTSGPPAPPCASRRHRSVRSKPRADEQCGVVEQLLGLTEPWHDVAAQHEIGIRVTDDEHQSTGCRHVTPR